MYSRWVVSALLALSALLTINSVGKPGTPTTNGTAIFVVLLSAVLIWGLLAGW